jgi:hypothetical protein
MEALVTADHKNGAPRPEWFDRAMAIIRDLEAAGREPGAVRKGDVQVHLAYPGNPHHAVFLGCFPLFSEAQSNEP